MSSESDFHLLRSRRYAARSGSSGFSAKDLALAAVAAATTIHPFRGNWNEIRGTNHVVYTWPLWRGLQPVYTLCDFHTHWMTQII